MNLSVLFQPKVTHFNDLPGTIVLFLKHNAFGSFLLNVNYNSPSAVIRLFLKRPLTTLLLIK